MCEMESHHAKRIVTHFGVVQTAVASPHARTWEWEPLILSYPFLSKKKKNISPLYPMPHLLV